MSVLSFLRKGGQSAVTNAAGYATGQAASAAITPAVQPIANDLWTKNPSIPTPLQIAAQVAIKSPELEAKMRDEARKQGFGDTAFDAAMSATDVPPGVGELLELKRRGEISEADLIAGFRGAMIEERWIGDLAKLQWAKLSPADLAMARQQAFIDVAEQKQRSEEQGVDADDAELLFKLAGLPYGGGEALDLWRRDLISEDRVNQALEEGHLKLEFIEDFKKLRWQPLSASVAAEALIRQRMSESKAVQIAEQNGIHREDFLLWSQMLGRPISITEGLQLARRGEFTYGQFVDIVARSDVRTEFAPDLWKLRRVIPPLFQLSRLISSGSITPELGTKYILELGYDVELAHALADAGTKSKTRKQRDLAASMIADLYDAGLETRDWAMQGLQAYGYDESESALYLELLDARRLLAAEQANLNKIHLAYVGHKTNRTKATDDLDALGILPEVRNTLLETWTHEREANVQRLTNAQIGSALKKGVIGEDDAIARWIANGYPQDDAEILARLAHKAGSTASSTAP